MGRLGVEGLIDGMAYGAAVLAEGGAGVVEVPQAVVIVYVGGPGVATVAAHGVDGPGGDGVQHGGLELPLLHVAARQHAYTHAGGKEVVTAVLAPGHHGVVHIGVSGVVPWVAATGGLLCLLGTVGGCRCRLGMAHQAAEK